MIKKGLLLITAALSLSACASLNYRQLKRESAEWEFHINAGPCFKACAVYQASVDESGQLRYNGMSQTGFKGDTLIDLGRDFAYNLMLDLEAMDYLAIPDSNGLDSTIFDVQSIQYELISDGQSKKVACQLEEPQDLYRLRQVFNSKLKELKLL